MCSSQSKARTQTACFASNRRWQSPRSWSTTLSRTTRKSSASWSLQNTSTKYSTTRAQDPASQLQHYEAVRIGRRGNKARPKLLKEFLDRHGLTAVSTVDLRQRQARLKDAFSVQYGQPQQAGPRRRTRVGSESVSQSPTVTQGHKRQRKGDSESQSNSKSRMVSVSRGGHGTQVIYLGLQYVYHA